LGGASGGILIPPIINSCKSTSDSTSQGNKAVWLRCPMAVAECGSTFFCHSTTVAKVIDKYSIENARLLGWTRTLACVPPDPDHKMLSIRTFYLFSFMSTSTHPAYNNINPRPTPVTASPVSRCFATPHKLVSLFCGLTQGLPLVSECRQGLLFSYISVLVDIP